MSPHHDTTKLRGLHKFMLPYEQALDIVLSSAPRMPAVEAVLVEAVGRVAAEHVVSDVDMPPFDKSAMDGYAVRAAEASGRPAEFRVVETVEAGDVPRRRIGSGESSRIMTGAPVPQGADAVVMVEATEPVGEGRVRVVRGVTKGENICRRGEDVRKGVVVVSEGTRLRPFEIALAAAVGRTRLSVYATPRVAVLATGDEVVEPDRVPVSGRIRNSNSYAVASRLLQAGIETEHLGIAPDEAGATLDLLERGLSRDVLIVSGGVSMGDRDLVPGLLRELGVELLFEKVAIQPGRPTIFGRRGNTLVFGLPGNPVATVVIAELILMPALRRMMGERSPGPETMEAVLDEPISHKPGRMSFRPVTVRWSEGAWHASAVEYHGSADLAGAARGQGFAAIPHGMEGLPAGATARVVMFR